MPFSVGSKYKVERLFRPRLALVTGRENPRVTFDAVVAAVANAEADALQSE